MISRQERFRRATLRSVRIMLAMGLIGRELRAPEAPPPARKKPRLHKTPVAGVFNSGKGASLPKGDRCEGKAPEGTSGAATGGYEEPANALQARPRDPERKPVTKRQEEGPAVEPVSRPASGRTEAATSERMDVTAGETALDAAPDRKSPAPLKVPRAKLDLGSAASGMEARAERWRSPVAISEALRDRSAAEAEAGRAFYKCGGPGREGGYVPAWFGRDCIEQDCPLRGSK